MKKIVTLVVKPKDPMKRVYRAVHDYDTAVKLKEAHEKVGDRAFIQMTLNNEKRRV